MTAAASHLNLDSSGHPDIETIAEYVEDLLAPEATAELSAHLTGCPACRESREALEEIRSLLGETEVPSIPEDVALRIDAALAAEAAVPSAGVHQADGPRRALPAPGAAPRGSVGPFRAAGPGDSRRRARRLRRAALGMASLAACGLIITAVLNTHTTESSSAKGAAAGGFSRAASGAGPRFTAFSQAGFTQQIQTLLAPPADQSNEPQIQGDGQHPESASTRSTGEPVAVTAPGCVLASVDRPGSRPTSVFLGTYQNIEVYALVYPAAGNPAHAVQAYLVDAACTTPAGHTTPVLLSQTVPRP